LSAGCEHVVKTRLQRAHVVFVVSAPRSRGGFARATDCCTETECDIYATEIIERFTVIVASRECLDR